MAPHRIIPRRRRVGFALAALLLGLSPLLVSEIVLRVADRGHVSDAIDPYVEFQGTGRLFVPNAESNCYEIPESRQTFFRPESFSMQKSDREFRIFCLGGSTVQGRPFAIETSFTTWLEIALQAADPDRKWEVINCGGVSYASYRLAPIMREVLDYEPDLFILYTGHNEFLEDRTYARIKHAPRWLTWSHRWLSTLRTYNTLRSLWLRMRAGQTDAERENRPQLPGEVEARLDYQGGLDDYRRDDAWQASIIEHFEFNVRRMVRMAHQAGVPIILVNPVSNLKDSPPFKFADSEGLSATDQHQFDRLWEEARSDAVTAAERIALLRRAIRIDQRHAGVLYHLAKCFEGQTQFDLARRQFLRARDEDICPLRILSAMNEVVVRVARSTPATLVDAQRLFDQLTKGGITGNEWLADHVHPSIRGHQRLAAALLTHMAERRMVQPRRGWERQRDKRYSTHFESLGAFYFIRGQQRLESLRRWSRGRATRIRTGNEPSSSPPTTGARTNQNTARIAAWEIKSGRGTLASKQGRVLYAF